MKLGVLLVFLVGSVIAAAPAQSGRQNRGAPAAASAASAVAEAYDQFMLGLRSERDDDVDGAIGAYKRAMALDPSAAEVPAELAGLYMRQNRITEAMATGEQSLKIAPRNAEAHRVLGTIYAALAESDSKPGGGSSTQASENATKAIGHLEEALRLPVGEPDPNLLANLARLYVHTGAYDKAIPMLRGLVDRERGWQDGVSLLVDAYAGAGKNAEAIAWLEEAAPDDPRLYPTLGDFYERERRWKDSAGAYALAVAGAPRNVALKVGSSRVDLQACKLEYSIVSPK